MPSSDPGRRAGRTATRVLAALGVAGTLGAAALAYSDTHTASATTSTSSSDTGTSTANQSSSTSSDDSGTSSATAPQVATGSGESHAQSAGS
ncbi:hypothetical protein [Nocardia miyunensis]|uniref:hypothetical protein n=1 Tax=Nocardia miyunensis TaxID=282684 RepID=UPI000A7E4D78|nr:hypothetical protein [Nocardia miyunensis]